MVKNTLGDLNGYLFEQLERLNDVEMDVEQLTQEIKRSKAVSGIAGNIIDNGKLVLEAQKFRDEKMDMDAETPKMLEG
jgi:predicted sugar kinase